MRKFVLFGLIGVLALAGAWVWWNGRELSSAKSGPEMVTVILPELDALQERGRLAFGANCASCHGLSAAGQAGVAPPLIHPIYEPGHHGDAAFVRAAQLGARAHHWPFGDMPPVEEVSEAELTQIIAYIRALQRANGIE